MTEDPSKGVVKGSEKERHLAGANQEGGLPEPKSAEDWAKRGAEGGEPGRSPPVRGGSSQGTGDQKDIGGSDSGDLDRPVGKRPQPEPGEG